jgi:acetyl esterase/lipase
VPGEKEAKHPAKIYPDSSGGVIRLTDITDPLITVYSPDKENNRHAGIIVCPGGGYKILAINLEGSEIAKWLTHNGITAFVLQYRVPNKQAGALQDVQRAIRIVRSKAAAFGIDTNRVGVMGFSAGGSLAARISTEYNHNWYKPIDHADYLPAKPDFTLLIYPAYLDKGPHHSLTPELKVNINTPPMFIFQTEDDPYGRSSLVMASALRKAKVPFELMIYPKGGHGYGLRKGNPAAEAWPPLALKWMKQILNK